jgi:hypothetical protein
VRISRRWVFEVAAGDDELESDEPGIFETKDQIQAQSSGCHSAWGACVRNGCKPTLVTSVPVDPITCVTKLGTEPTALPTAWPAADRALLTGLVALSVEFDIACLTSPSDSPAIS